MDERGSCTKLNPNWLLFKKFWFVTLEPVSCNPERGAFFLAKWLFRSDLWLACSHKAFLTVFTKNLSIFSKFFPKFLCFLEEKFLYIEKLKVKFQPLKRKKIFFWQKRLQSNKFGLMNCILIRLSFLCLNMLLRGC